MPAEVQRRRWQFYGRVQGVGFRYHAYYAAESLGLTGWVENEYDGSVTLEAQGEKQALDRLVPMLCKTSSWIMIEDMTVCDLPLDEGERRFAVRGY